MSSNSQVSQHKRLAMGQGLAMGGKVMGPSPTPTGAGKLVPSVKGASPLTTARKNNGMPGMAKGGGVKKK